MATVIIHVRRNTQYRCFLFYFSKSKKGKLAPGERSSLPPQGQFAPPGDGSSISNGNQGVQLGPAFSPASNEAACQDNEAVASSVNVMI